MTEMDTNKFTVVCNACLRRPPQNLQTGDDIDAKREYAKAAVCQGAGFATKTTGAVVSTAFMCGTCGALEVVENVLHKSGAAAIEVAPEVASAVGVLAGHKLTAYFEKRMVDGKQS